MRTSIPPWKRSFLKLMRFPCSQCSYIWGSCFVNILLEGTLVSVCYWVHDIDKWLNELCDVLMNPLVFEKLLNGNFERANVSSGNHWFGLTFWSIRDFSFSLAKVLKWTFEYCFFIRPNFWREFFFEFAWKVVFSWDEHDRSGKKTSNEKEHLFDE